MQTKFIEATDATEFNWGKFMVCRFTPEEWAARSVISGSGSPLLRQIGWDEDQIIVFDLQTCEGAGLRPGCLAAADMNKHRICVCPMFEPFLGWLYQQDLKDLSALPALVNLGDVPTALYGYRRASPGSDDVTRLRAQVLYLRETLQSLAAEQMEPGTWAIKCIEDHNAIISEVLERTA